MERVILHLDMDAFFAAVEQRDRPELRGRPVIIGHPGPRGVVSTCSYEARRFGVRSAMPSVTAARLCPDGVWLHPRFEAYSAASKTIFTLFREQVPVVEQVSVDEAYGDLTGAVRDLAGGAALARRLKGAIRAAEGITASAGLSYCRFLAKIASDLEKPDGLCVLAPADVTTRVWPLPVRVVPGIGPKSAEHLLRIGVKTVGELARCPEERLKREFGTATALYFHQRAQGLDDTPVEPGGERKQVSEERTYGTDLHDPRDIERELLARCDGIAGELRRKHVLARTVTIKVRDGDYRTITRSHTSADALDLTADLYEAALRLFRERVVLEGRGVRLLGVAAKDLVHAKDVAPPLFPDERRERDGRVSRAVDALRARFGDDAVKPARLIDKP